MKEYREYIGWGAIVVAALSFIPVPLPALPPMLSAPMLMLLPGVGPVGQPWPPEASWTETLPALIHGIIARRSLPTFSIRCWRPSASRR